MMLSSCLPACNDPTHPTCFMRWLRANTRVLSRSKDGMSVTIGVDHDYSKYVHLGRPLRSHPFRKR